MMGSADALPEEPAVRPMFVEDMTEEQLASAVSKPWKLPGQVLQTCWWLFSALTLPIKRVFLSVMFTK